MSTFTSTDPGSFVVPAQPSVPGVGQQGSCRPGAGWKRASRPPRGRPGHRSWAPGENECLPVVVEAIRAAMTVVEAVQPTARRGTVHAADGFAVLGISDGRCRVNFEGPRGRCSQPLASGVCPSTRIGLEKNIWSRVPPESSTFNYLLTPVGSLAAPGWPGFIGSHQKAVHRRRPTSMSRRRRNSRRHAK